jgi:hypothetical protein
MIVEATLMDIEISFNLVSISDEIQSPKSKHRFERQISGYPGPEWKF